MNALKVLTNATRTPPACQPNMTAGSTRKACQAISEGIKSEGIKPRRHLVNHQMFPSKLAINVTQFTTLVNERKHC